MSTAVLVLPQSDPMEDFLRDYEMAQLMVDTAIQARAIQLADREEFIAAVFTAINLVRIRRGEKEPR